MQLLESGPEGMQAFHQALELRMLYIVHTPGCSRQRFGSSLRHCATLHPEPSTHQSDA